MGNPRGIEMTYQAHIINCGLEVDLYDEGCQLEGGRSVYIDQTITAPTLPELLQKVADDYEIHRSDIQAALNTPDTIQWNRTENEDGFPPFDGQTEAWMKGKETLYLANYYARITKIEPVDLTWEAQGLCEVHEPMSPLTKEQ